MRVRDIAGLLTAVFEGDGDLEIAAAAPIESAGPSELSFAMGQALAKTHESSAGCLIVPIEFPNETGRTVIRVGQPRSAFAIVLARLYPSEPTHAGVHASAAIASSASVDPSCEIGPHVSIGEGARIGAATHIGAGSRIGANSVIGAGCILYANVTIYDNVQIGDRVILHSGCVLGADGFGFVFNGQQYEKFPQVGRVIIHDDVEIGANACVDRAALGTTEIEAGAKLDNMVHIGHNCRIGRHVVIAAQTGLSGGVVIEDYAVVGGQVGIGDKARIESRAVLGSGSGILTSKIVRAGEPVWGTPARPLRQYLQQLAMMSRLPRMREEIAALRERIAQLERRQ